MDERATARPGRVRRPVTKERRFTNRPPEKTAVCKPPLLEVSRRSYRIESRANYKVVTLMSVSLIDLPLKLCSVASFNPPKSCHFSQVACMPPPEAGI